MGDVVKFERKVPKFIKYLAVVGFHEVATGGGCNALRAEYEDGSYILLTDHEDAQVPEDAMQISCGFYSPDGSFVKDYGVVTALQAAHVYQFEAPEEFMVSLEILIDEWGTWCAEHGLRSQSADEMLSERQKELLPSEVEYIVEYIDRWDYVQTWGAE